MVVYYFGREINHFSRSFELFLLFFLASVPRPLSLLSCFMVGGESCVARALFSIIVAVCARLKFEVILIFCSLSTPPPCRLRADQQISVHVSFDGIIKGAPLKAKHNSTTMMIHTFWQFIDNKKRKWREKGEESIKSTIILSSLEQHGKEKN